jgi:hypothetical protein
MVNFERKETVLIDRNALNSYTYLLINVNGKMQNFAGSTFKN